MIENKIKQAIRGYLASIYRRETNLSKQTKVSGDGDDMGIYLPTYIESIEKGRRPGDSPLPIKSLLSWMLRAGIPNSTAIAYRIQQSIVRKGVKPRHILSGIEKVVEETVNQYFTVEVDNDLNLKINK